MTLREKVEIGFYGTLGAFFFIIGSDMLKRGASNPNNCGVFAGLLLIGFGYITFASIVEYYNEKRKKEVERI